MKKFFSLALWLAASALPVVAAGDIIQAIELAKRSYQPVSAQELEKARAGLKTSVTSLGQLLRSRVYESEWKGFLLWDQLERQCANAPDVATLEVLRERCSRNEPGMERAEILEVRSRLKAYRDLVVFAQVPQGREKFLTSLEALASALKRYAVAPSWELSDEIGKLLAWIEGTRRAPWLVEAAQERVSQPNMTGRVSLRLLKTLVKSDYQDPDYVSKMKRWYNDTFYNAQARLDIFPRSVKFGFSGSQISLSQIRRRQEQLGAPGAAPVPKTIFDAADVAVAMHESEFNNFYGNYVSGNTLKDEEFADILKAVTGSVPTEYRLGNHLARWSLTFAKERGLRFHFGENVMEARFQITQVTIADRKQDASALVTVKYEPRRSALGPEFARIGEVQIEPLDSARPLPAELKIFLQKKLSALLPELFHLNGLVPPQGGPLDSLLDLCLQLWETHEGWLLGAWNLEPGSAATRFSWSPVTEANWDDRLRALRSRLDGILEVPTRAEYDKKANELVTALNPEPRNPAWAKQAQSLAQGHWRYRQVTRVGISPLATAGAMFIKNRNVSAGGDGADSTVETGKSLLRIVDPSLTEILEEAQTKSDSGVILSESTLEKFGVAARLQLELNSKKLAEGLISGRHDLIVLPTEEAALLQSQYAAQGVVLKAVFGIVREEDTHGLFVTARDAERFLVRDGSGAIVRDVDGLPKINFDLSNSEHREWLLQQKLTLSEKGTFAEKLADLTIPGITASFPLSPASVVVGIDDAFEALLASGGVAYLHKERGKQVQYRQPGRYKNPQNLDHAMVCLLQTETRELPPMVALTIASRAESETRAVAYFRAIQAMQQSNQWETHQRLSVPMLMPDARAIPLANGVLSTEKSAPLKIAMPDPSVNRLRAVVETGQSLPKEILFRAEFRDGSGYFYSIGPDSRELLRFPPVEKYPTDYPVLWQPSGAGEKRDAGYYYFQAGTARIKVPAPGGTPKR